MKGGLTHVIPKLKARKKPESPQKKMINERDGKGGEVVNTRTRYENHFECDEESKGGKSDA
jgi:hypothetical protein